MKSDPTPDGPVPDVASVGDRISYATLELISERGLNDVTMSAVADRAGVARQTLYNHYPNIDAIVGAVVVRHQEETLQALNSAIVTMSSPLDQLAHLVRHTASMSQHGHPPVKRGLAGNVQAALDQHDEQMRGLVAHILQSGVDRGEMRSSLEPPRDALTIQRMIESTSELVAADPHETAAIVDSVVATVLAAVAA